MQQLILRLRYSLFAVPAVYMLGGAGLGWVTNLMDQQLGPDGAPYLLPATLAGSRAVLSTIAGATITVAALVFSITALTVQLAASQYSPRVLQGFLRDPFHQSVIGIVTGTFTYSVVALATVGSNRLAAENDVVAAWATTVATVLAVASVVAIVGFIDHITKRIRVDDMIRRLVQATTTSMQDTFERSEPMPTGSGLALEPDAGSAAVRADEGGWVQRIDPGALLDRLAAGAVVRIDVATGSHVTARDRIATIWPAEAAGNLPRSDEWLTVGETRTTEQDPGFGIRQLVDIALRALSPGINDPATAADVLRHMVEPLRVTLTSPPRQRVIAGADGRRVMLPAEPDRNDFVRLALSEIRMASGAQLLVVHAFIETVGSLIDQLRDSGIDPDQSGLAEQLDGLLAELDFGRLGRRDSEGLRAELERWGLESHFPEEVGPKATRESTKP